MHDDSFQVLEQVATYILTLGNGWPLKHNASVAAIWPLPVIVH